MRRIIVDGADYEFAGVSVHSAWGVVCGWEADRAEYMDRNGLCVWWDRVMCGVEVIRRQILHRATLEGTKGEVLRQNVAQRYSIRAGVQKPNASFLQLF